MFPRLDRSDKSDGSRAWHATTLRVLPGGQSASTPTLQGMSRGMGVESDERLLVQRCADGDPHAIAEFQERFGPLVYSFPVRVYRLPAEEAGDFYVFVFENGRLFRRLRSFAGRVSLRRYLLGFALDHLLIEWRRGRREVETVSIEALREQDPHFDIAGEGASEDAEPHWLDRIASLPPQKTVIAKLLHVEDAEFSPAEIRYLCAASGKRAAQVLREIEELRAQVREREAAQQGLLEQIDGVHAWIELYRKRLQRIAAELAVLPHDAAEAQKLRREKEELSRKLAWREQQRERLRQLARRRKVTAPYKEIARVLGTTVGNVASMIQRVRREIAEQLLSERHSRSARKGDAS